MSVARPVTAEELSQPLARTGINPSFVRDLLVRALGRGDHELCWFEFLLHPGASGWADADEPAEMIREAAKGGHSRSLARLAMAVGLSETQDDSHNARFVYRTLVKWLGVRDSVPEVQSVEAFRRVGPADSGSPNAGAGLIERLAQLQNPSVANEADRDRFRAMNEFVRELTGDANAIIEIPADRDMITVRLNGVRRPLESFGTGLHEVIILAASATVYSRTLLCIEEPEVHLHPALQRKLLRYLVEETDNQYLIATHSAHFLDSERASITAVRLSEGRSVLSAAVEPAELAEISAELGFRASDLVQSNAIVWVEGPSDRVYLRHWISQLDARLIEGAHYTLAFYGGALLKHLHPTDPAVEDFVSLPRINRNFAVVIDSDKTAARQRINRTKARVRDAVQDAGGRGTVWVTDGYTIENYVPPDVLSAAVRSVHPATTCRWTGERYLNPLGKPMLVGRDAVDKTAVARKVVESWPGEELGPLDWRKPVGKLVQMIREANDLPPLTIAGTRAKEA